MQSSMRARNSVPAARWSMVVLARGWLLRPARMVLAVIALSAGLSGARSWAGEIDDANARLIDLEERVRILASEFRDAPATDPNTPVRRVLDAEMLFNLKNYTEAATILLDVIDKYPTSLSYDDAIVLLGESLYQERDLNSARRYFRQAIVKNTGSSQEQKALQRLIEIALHTGDYEGVDEYLARLESIPVARLEPSVPYVRAKYAYSRERIDQAEVGFAGIPATSPYSSQARYFLATIKVKRGELDNALALFNSLLRNSPRDETEREVQDLARMAVGRLYYEKGQFDKARDAYKGIPKESKYFEDAMHELAWTSIKAADFKNAYWALDLMLLQNPDSPQAPELRLLMGNIHVRLADFAMANDAFLLARDQFEPIHKQLKETLKRCESDSKYFDALLGKGMEKFDIAVFVPKTAVKWVKADAEVAQVIALAENVGELERNLKDAQETLARLEMAVSGQLKVGIFPDLAQSRMMSSEILNQLIDIRTRFLNRVRSLITKKLTPEEKARLDQVARERTALEGELKNLPLNANGLKEREKQTRGELDQLDARASEFNVEIQGMEAELVAIEQYFIKSRADQKIKPEDLSQPVAGLREAISEIRDNNEKVRSAIAEAAREASVNAATGDSDRNAIALLVDTMKRERSIFQGARARLSSGDQETFDRVAAILAKADGVQARLAEYDSRVDAAALRRIAVLKQKLTVEKGELEAARNKMTGILTESQSLGGGLAFALLGKITDRFYDLVVQSDVGLVDVAWGLKDERTSAVSKLINQQKLELKAVEEDFHSLLEEDR